MTVENYLTAWGAYLLASIVTIWIVGYWTKKLPFPSIRGLLRLLVACVLLTPYYTVPDESLMSPLVMAVGMEILSGNMDKAIEMTKPAQFYFALMAGIWLSIRIFYLLVMRPQRRALKAQEAKAKDAQGKTSEAAEAATS